MTNKFKNKYRISSARLQNWDYGWDGAYFITICTKNREWFFGDVVDGKMKLSHAGLIAKIMWYEIKNHAKNIKFGAYQIMPNHMHGILILEGNGNSLETRHVLSLRASRLQLSRQTPSCTQSKKSRSQTIGQQRFQNQGENTISSICGGYKSSVSKHCNRLGFESGWQPRFHDHIIRDQGEFDRITNYIENNPRNWKDDTFFKQTN